MAVESVLAKIPGYSKLNGIPHSPSVPQAPPSAGTTERINNLVTTYINKHSIIPGGGFQNQMAALTTLTKDTGHTEIQARLLGHCWQNICEHWGLKSKNGKSFVPCPRGENCKMKHDNPAQWNPMERDVCVLLLESYPANQMENLFEIEATNVKQKARKPRDRRGAGP